MDRVRRLVITHLWWVVLLIALGLLASHTFGFQRVAVDTTSLVLLVLILISPFVAAIKKLKIGDFEAEIEPEEVRRVTETAEKLKIGGFEVEIEPEKVRRVTETAEKSLPATAPDTVSERPPTDLFDRIRTLAETDPIIALAKIRIECETRVRRLYEQVTPRGSTSHRKQPLAKMIRDLVNQQVIPKPFSLVLNDVIALCTRAIHGEDIREIDARQVIELGVDLLKELDRMVSEYIVTRPIETTTVTPGERDDFFEAQYRLTTIVPLVKDPQRNVYILDQEGLNQFLENYTEHAEFLIRLEKLESSPRHEAVPRLDEQTSIS